MYGRFGPDTDPESWARRGETLNELLKIFGNELAPNFNQALMEEKKCMAEAFQRERTQDATPQEST